MDYSKTKLYKVVRKRDLSKILKGWLNSDLVHNANVLYSPYIQKNPKPRLIENPKDQLKFLQRIIKNLLFELDYPINVFSGLPSKCYIDNALYHIDSSYFLKIDLTKFFPNTHREKIYHFYKEKLLMSSDVAEIMTNLSTINLKLIENSSIESFLFEKKLNVYNHLPSGSPISSVLSYLANIDMFDEIQDLCLKNQCRVSFYVDDITVSSNNEIPKRLLNEIERIVNKHFHNINKGKTKTYFSTDYKKITGCVISNNKELVIPNKTRKKIISLMQTKKYDEKNLQKLLGLVRTAQMYEKNKYLSLQRYLKIKQQDLKTKNKASKIAIR